MHQPKLKSVASEPPAVHICSFNHVMAAVLRHVDVAGITQDYDDYALLFGLSESEASAFQSKCRATNDLSDIKALQHIRVVCADKVYSRSERCLVLSSLVALYAAADDEDIEIDYVALAEDLAVPSKDTHNRTWHTPAAPKSSSVTQTELRSVMDTMSSVVGLHASAAADHDKACAADAYVHQSSVKFNGPIQVFGAVRCAAPVKLRRFGRG